MSRDSGSEEQPGQRTVADLLKAYGSEGGEAAQRGGGDRRRRRRSDDMGDTAPHAIIDRVLSDSGQMRPIRPDDEPAQPGSHRSSRRRQNQSGGPQSGGFRSGDLQSGDLQSGGIRPQQADQQVPPEGTPAQPAQPPAQPPPSAVSEPTVQNVRPVQPDPTQQPAPPASAQQGPQPGTESPAAGQYWSQFFTGAPSDSAQDPGQSQSGQSQPPQSQTPQSQSGQIAPGVQDPEATARQPFVPATQQQPPSPDPQAPSPQQSESAPNSGQPYSGQQAVSGQLGAGNMGDHSGPPGGSGQTVEATEKLRPVRPEGAGAAGGTAMLPQPQQDDPYGYGSVLDPAQREPGAEFGADYAETGFFGGSVDGYDDYEYGDFRDGRFPDGDFQDWDFYNGDYRDGDYDDSDYPDRRAAGANADRLADLDEEERSPGKEWFVLTAQGFGGLFAGAVVWGGFSWLWKVSSIAAFVAALLVTGALVLLARRMRGDDLQIILLAVLAGLFCTVSPVALLLLGH